MKKLAFAFTLLLFFISSLIHSQQKEAGWVYLEDGMTTSLKFTKSETSNSINDFTFKSVWRDKLDLPDEEYSYGGISELHVYKGQTRVQTIKNIADYIGLRYVYLTFFDYNMDGHLDFSVQISCGGSCYDAYYLYDPKNKGFTHQKDWDYLRIDSFNKTTKQIRSVPDGNAADTKHDLYKVDGHKLIKVKTMN